MSKNSQPKASNNTHTTRESENTDSGVAEQIDDNNSLDPEYTSGDPGSTLLIGGGASVDIARRAGIDRHAEADYAERAYEKAVAKMTGGNVVEDGTSAFTPDGGIDSVVDTESGDMHIQTKHYGRKVSESTIKKYAEDVDVIGATNGVKQDCTPEEYGVDVVTSKHWSYRARTTLELKRIARGYRKGVTGIINRTRVAATYLVDGTKVGGRLVYMGGKSIRHNVTKTASAVAVRFAKASLRKKAVMGIVGLIILYLIHQWYTDENENNWIE
jgi:hypothetical protein